MTDPQTKHYDTQDIFNIDIDDLYNRFIVPIDNLRSHFNALVSGSQQLNTPDYQESRCHAFLRMIGFPVAASASSFYSPGHDPTANADPNVIKTNTQIAQKLLGNQDFITSSATREAQGKIYKNIWGSGGINAIAISLGSIHIRNFDNQFSDSIGPLELDSNQAQQVPARLEDIKSFFGRSSQTYASQLKDINLNYLTSTHFIKPFIVDPRIDNSIRPAVNRIAAPFLLSKNQTKIFDPQTGNPAYLSRPYIEQVISIRFNNTNITQTAPQPFVDSVVNFIKSSDTVTDQDLINIVSNPNAKLHTSELTVFSNYLKIIRALITTLHEATRNIDYVRQNINFQPIPNPTKGIEAGSEGGTIQTVIAGDPNNLKRENDIAYLTQKKTLDEVAYELGLDSTPDLGDFAFSNIDDVVFNANKNVKKSYDDQLNTANSFRNKLGSEGLDSLKEIEIITGEFSGLGLLDIMAIQAALWIMDSSSLVGLIDPRAQARLAKRNDITAQTPNPSVISSITQFESVLKQIYKLIGSYIQVLETQGNYTDVGA